MADRLHGRLFYALSFQTGPFIDFNLIPFFMNTTDVDVITPAEMIPISKFQITMDSIDEMIKQSSALEIKGVDDKEGLKNVHETRMKFVRTRTAVEKRTKELNARAKAYTNKVKLTSDFIIKKLLEGETPLHNKEKAIEQELANHRAEKLRIEQERLAKERQEEVDRLAAIKREEDEKELQRVRDRIAEEQRLANEEIDRKKKALEEEERIAKERQADIDRRLAETDQQIREAQSRIAEENRLLNERQQKVEAEEKALAEQKLIHESAEEVRQELEEPLTGFFHGQPYTNSPGDPLPRIDDADVELREKAATQGPLYYLPTRADYEADIEKLLHRFKLIIGNTEDMEALRTNEAKALWSQLTSEVVSLSHKSIARINKL